MCIQTWTQNGGDHATESHSDCCDVGDGGDGGNDGGDDGDGECDGDGDGDNNNEYDNGSSGSG